MTPENYTEIAKEHLKASGLMERVYARGKPLFMILTGAHNFGFPSHDSDFDIRGVYLAPKEKFLGMRKRVHEPSFKAESLDRVVDLAVEEAGQFFSLVADSNGNRVEWVNSPYVICVSSEFQDLKGVVNTAGVSKELVHQFLHFAQDMWGGKTKAEGVKKDLYSLRVYMAGINLADTGKIESDITKLNYRFGYLIVDEMIRVKSGGEMGAAEGYDREKVGSIISELDYRLRDSLKASKLQDSPDVEKINDFLIKLRES